MKRLWIRHRVLLATIYDNFIMGIDLIGKYGFANDTGHQILKFGKENFVLLISGGEGVSVRLYTWETTRINGSSAEIINAWIWIGNNIGLVEAAEDTTNKQLLVVRTLIEPPR